MEPQGTENQTVIDDNSQYVGRSIRVFISYDSEDKILAGRLKFQLESFGLEVFVAHDDISPSTEWQEVILQNIDSTDIFLPVITEHFKESKWTDQETGIAFSKAKLVIPLSVDGSMPYGFIGRFQALKLRTESLPLFVSSCDEVVSTIMKNERYFPALTDSLIKRLPGVYSFENAARVFRILKNTDSFSDRQINEIIKCSSQNGQIHHSWDALPIIQGLITKYASVISPELLKPLLMEFETDE